MYLSLRATDPTPLPRFDRAVRFFYLNRFCFNGLYRTNRSGGFNVPYAATRTGGFPPVERFAECGRLLQRAKISHGDFEDTIRRHVGKDDFVYLDPPFAVSNRRLFRQYGPDTFGLDDLDRLRSALRLIDKRGATFVLSYADSPEARKYLSAWPYRRVFVQRNVAGFSADRRRSVELIASNVKVWPKV
jgi:DNA adenine methylase